jgi:uncharacterized protein YndB with AHSA1/START domain
MSDTSAPVSMETTVTSPVDDAFRVFTKEIGTWWPVEEHSIGGERVEDVVIEPGVGGRVYERLVGGEERDWGEVLEWDEPHKLVLSWHPNADRPAATEVEVRFDTVEGGTRVSLEHRGWERLGADAAEARESYRTGWPGVMDRYVAGCAALAEASG